jgi:prepilin-type N-terminal cleavage/methylation domain-containing protein
MKLSIENEIKSVKNQSETILKNSRERERERERERVLFRELNFRNLFNLFVHRFSFFKNTNSSSFKNKKLNLVKNSAFTLIELLVVVAIIGILASVVLASLNSARQKARVVSIKSNLKNMGPQMEIAYSDSGNYGSINTGGSLPYQPNTNCIGPISNMVTSIKNTGAIVRCLSYNYPTWGDTAQRWAVTTLLSGTNTPLEVYSATQTGVVKWDTQGVNTTGVFVTPDVQMNWDQANTACALSGGRLPTVEELKTLADTYCEALGSTDCTVDSVRNPPGFVANNYWSSVTVPAIPTNAYTVNFSIGYLNYYTKSVGLYVRCVR